MSSPTDSSTTERLESRSKRQKKLSSDPVDHVYIVVYRGYVGDDILPSDIGIMISECKVPIDLMECHQGFEHTPHLQFYRYRTQKTNMEPQNWCFVDVSPFPSHRSISCKPSYIVFGVYDNLTTQATTVSYNIFPETSSFALESWSL